MQFTLEPSFVAPIDAGAHFMWIRFRKPNAGFLEVDRVEVVFDLNGGPVFGDNLLDAVLSLALHKRVGSPDVTQMLTALGFVVNEQREARCLRAFITTKHADKGNHARTTLLCEAVEPNAYR